MGVETQRGIKLCRALNALDTRLALLLFRSL